MSKPPTCKTCGKAEWQHTCAGVSSGNATPRTRLAIASRREGKTLALAKARVTIEARGGKVHDARKPRKPPDKPEMAMAEAPIEPKPLAGGAAEKRGRGRPPILDLTPEEKMARVRALASARNKALRARKKAEAS